MIVIRGPYNGSVVVLLEPAPVDHEVDVLVTFPDDEPGRSKPHQLHWDETRRITEGSHIDSTDIIRQMRDED